MQIGKVQCLQRAEQSKAHGVPYSHAQWCMTLCYWWDKQCVMFGETVTPQADKLVLMTTSRQYFISLKRQQMFLQNCSLVCSGSTSMEISWIDLAEQYTLNSYYLDKAKMCHYLYPLLVVQCWECKITVHVYTKAQRVQCWHVYLNTRHHLTPDVCVCAQ